MKWVKITEFTSQKVSDVSGDVTVAYSFYL